MAAAKDSKAAGAKAKSGTKSKAANTKAGVTKTAAAPKKGGRKRAAAAEVVEPVVPDDAPAPAARAKKDAVKKAKAKEKETGDPGVAAPASMKKSKPSKEADVPGIKPDVEEEQTKPAATPKSATKKKAATSTTPKKATVNKATPKKEADAAPAAAKPAAKKRKASTIEESEAKAKAAVAAAAKKQKISNDTAVEAQGILGMVSSGLQAAQKRVSDLFGVLGGSDDGRETQKKKAPKKSATKAKAATSGEATEEGDPRGGRAAADSDDGELQDDDPAAAYLRGFESSDEEAASGEEGFAPGKPLPKLPSSKGLAKRLKGAATKEEPGVVYIGRIPHGFHENEMRAYFSQFGTVEHVRLSRSKKTGQSKHYAFLQFASAEVARIAAETMNNYLMFGHILKCRVIPPAQVHPNLWVGADRRFKTVPWNKIEGRKLAQPKGTSDWDARVTQEEKRRASKAAKLKAIGYEFEAPTLKRPGDVQPKVTVAKETTLVTTDDAIGAVSTEVKRRPVAADFLPDEPAVVEEVAAKATKATKKAKKAVEALVEDVRAEVVDEDKAAAAGKAKKGKAKSKGKGKA